MTASALMDADEGYDVMWILPISALFKDIMWVKVGRTQWVLIEEMPGGRPGLDAKALILVFYLGKQGNVP